MKKIKIILFVLVLPFQLINWLITNNHIKFNEYFRVIRYKIVEGEYPDNYTLY